jgi:methionine-gamma-lyase
LGDPVGVAFGKESEGLGVHLRDVFWNAGADHIVAQRSMYGGSLSLVQKLLSRLGVDHTLVDQSDAGAWEGAITPATRLFLIESPSNPRLEITDLRAVAGIARARGILTLADNTFATPVNQRPLGLALTWSGTARRSIWPGIRTHPREWS